MSGVYWMGGGGSLEPYGLPWYCQDTSAEEEAEIAAWWQDLYDTMRPEDDPT